MYWINGEAVLVAPKSENAEGEEDIEDSEDDEEQNQDDVISLKLNDTVTRIAYIKDWSLVRLPDGREGYIMNSHLSAEEIVEEPETTDEPEDVSYDDDDDDDSSYTEPDPEPYSEPDPEPETSSGPDWEEWDVDYTVYASTALNTRTGPGISYTLLSTLSTGSEIEVVAETDNGWYKSADGYYVKASFTQEDEPYIPEPVYYDDDDDDEDYYESDDWSSFASYVRGFIGCRYVYGGASPDGFDCSGFAGRNFSHFYLPPLFAVSVGP
jgi:SH3-like domain-containing protein